MKNKEFLIEALQELLDVWPDAEVIIKNLKANNYDENTIDFLADQLRNSINEVEDKEKKEKMKKWLDVITEIWELEDKDLKNDKQDLNKIEKMLDEL